MLDTATAKVYYVFVKRERRKELKMFYVVEKDLQDFNFWAGARTVANEIDELDNADECWEYLQEIIEEDAQNALYYNETQINDFVWFEAWDLLEAAEYINEDEE